MSAVPRVSVIITSYNQRDYLIEAIESVIAQTQKPYEIIVADDHSTRDDSVDVIRGYMSRYPGWVKGVFHEKNVKLPTNRNSALAVVEGEYVAILDGDDRFLPTNIEAQMAGLARRPEAGCSYSNIYRMTAEGERYEVRDRYKRPAGDILVPVACYQQGILRSLFARFDLVKRAGMMDTRYLHSDGFLLTLRLAALTQFVYTLEPLVEKRSHSISISKTMNRQELASNLEEAQAETLKFVAGRNLPIKDLQQIQEAWFWKILDARVAANLQVGRKLNALSLIAKGTAQRPRQWRKMWQLARQAFH
jgi:glycosyltransferase involved in cell wall biosynthesis